MEQVLIKEKKYSGQYVVIKDLSEPTVISYGNDPQQIYNEALEKGYFEPLIIFIPSKEMVQIYAASRHPIY